MRFYGRETELDALRREIKRTESGSRFTVLKGRRGVGKTALLLKAAQESGRPVLYFLCGRKLDEASIARGWLDSVRSTLGLSEGEEPGRCSEQLSLSGIIRLVLELSREKPCCLIIDECQELDAAAPRFWADLRGVWDQCRDHSHAWLAMCGTDAELMRRIFEDPRGPLSEIRDLSIALRPFAPGLLRKIFLDLAPQGSAEDLLARDFRLESPVNYGVMREVAAGTARWAEIARVQPGRSISGCMSRLENRHGLLKKVAPMFSESSKGMRFEITDPYLRFWFRFVEPLKCQTLAERGDWEALRKLCLAGLPRFEEETLAAWFRERYAESDRWTRIGRWWDRQGRNEIGLIALNEAAGRWEISEVKRNPAEIDLGLLRMKAIAFERAAGCFLKKMDAPRLRGLSLEDVLRDPRTDG